MVETGMVIWAAGVCAIAVVWYVIDLLVRWLGRPACRRGRKY